MTDQEVRDAVRAMVEATFIWPTERWADPIVNQDFSFDFEADRHFFETSEQAQVAGAARSATRDALRRRTREALQQVASILGYDAGGLLGIATDTAEQTASDVGSGLVQGGNAIIGAAKGAAGQLETVGKVLPWALAALVAWKVLK